MWGQNSAYDCLWLDVDLPGISGIELAAILREQGYDRFIVAVTGMVDSETIRKCEKAGINYVLAKPVTKVETLTQPIFEVYK